MTRKDLPHVLLALALIGYTLLVARYVSPYVGGSDSSGYFNTALLLSEGRATMPPRTIDGVRPGENFDIEACTPLGFRTRTDRTITPTYPIGLSLVTAALAPLVGWDQVVGVVCALHMLAGVLAVGWLARLSGLPPGWAWFAALLVAGSPLYLFIGFQFLSDVPSLTWCTLAVAAALQSQRNVSWAAVAGVCVGMAVLARPTNCLILLPVLVALPLNWRSWVLLSLGGAPLALLFGVYNHHAYGTAFTTGYGNIDFHFSTKWIWPTLRHCFNWLPILLSPVVVLALALPAAMRHSPRLTLTLGLWVLVFIAFYACYELTHLVWWYLRFILPVFPPLVIAGLLVLRRLLQLRQWDAFRLDRRAVAMVSVAVVLVVLANQRFWARKLAVLHGKQGDRSYHLTADWLNRHAPANAAVWTMQSSGSVYAYTSFPIIRWDYIDDASLRTLQEALQRGKQPLYAVLYAFERPDAFARLPAEWREVANFGDARIYQWADPAQSGPAPAGKKP